MTRARTAPIGIFGGTFDPIHHGHLRLAVELRERLKLREVRLIPNAMPPHRGAPGADPSQRMRWIREAIDGQPGLVLDRRELVRGGPSYTVDTLASLRSDLPGTPLCLILGMDTFLGLESWYRWRDLIELAHLVIAPRPGVAMPAEGALGELARHHETTRLMQLHECIAGCIYQCDTTRLAISSTEIRGLLGAGRSIRYLVPDPVWRDLDGATSYDEGTNGRKQAD